MTAPAKSLRPPGPLFLVTKFITLITLATFGADYGADSVRNVGCRTWAVSRRGFAGLGINFLALLYAMAAVHTLDTFKVRSLSVRSLGLFIVVPPWARHASPYSAESIHSRPLKVKDSTPSKTLVPLG